MRDLAFGGLVVCTLLFSNWSTGASQENKIDRAGGWIESCLRVDQKRAGTDDLVAGHESLEDRIIGQPFRRSHFGAELHEDSLEESRLGLAVDDLLAAGVDHRGLRHRE